MRKVHIDLHLPSMDDPIVTISITTIEHTSLVDFIQSNFKGYENSVWLQSIKLAVTAIKSGYHEGVAIKCIIRQESEHE